MLEAYRDRHVEHIAAHLSLLVFLKEQEVDQELILQTLHDIRQLGPSLYHWVFFDNGLHYFLYKFSSLVRLTLGVGVCKV